MTRPFARVAIKGDLQKMCVMAKREGAGAELPAATASEGDRVCGVYLADGKTPATADFAGRRGFHAPLASTDYVARYGEHFEHRM